MESFVWKGPYRKVGTVPMAEIVKLCNTGHRRTLHLPGGVKVRIIDIPSKELFRLRLSEDGAGIREFFISAGSIWITSRNNGAAELPWSLPQYMSYKDVDIGVPQPSQEMT
ncbi:hypothetical protein HYU72_00835 [Candidatus Berkelbacteria bacterium]|nr:hypothetical protein [Candidatus Berkelbacteria bacterium]